MGEHMDVFTLGDGGSEFDNLGWFKNTGRFEQETKSEES